MSSIAAINLPIVKEVVLYDLPDSIYKMTPKTVNRTNTTTKRDRLRIIYLFLFRRLSKRKNLDLRSLSGSYFGVAPLRAKVSFGMGVEENAFFSAFCVKADCSGLCGPLCDCCAFWSAICGWSGVGGSCGCCIAHGFFTAEPLGEPRAIILAEA